jgi:hypothetical protein
MKQAAVNPFENRLHTSRRRSRFTHIGCFEADFFITHVSWTQRSGLIPIRFKLPLIQVAEYGEQWCGLHGLLRVPLPLLYFKVHSPGVQDVWIQDATWLCPLSTILPSKSARGSSVIRLWAVIFLQPQVTSDAVAYDPNECMAARPMVCGAGSNWVLTNGHFLAPSRHLLIRVHGHN